MEIYMLEMLEENPAIILSENNIRIVQFVFYDDLKIKYVWWRRMSIYDIIYFDFYDKVTIKNKKFKKYIKPMIKALFEENK